MAANPARGLSAEQGKENKREIKAGSAPQPRRCSFGENNIKSRDASIGATKTSVRLVRVQDSFGSSTRPPMGVASQNSTLLPCAIAIFPVSLPLLSSPGDA